MPDLFSRTLLPRLRLCRLPDSGRPYIWRADPGEQACPDCMRLDGDVRPLEEWQNTVTPGSPGLVCRGRNCACRLEATLQPATRRAVSTPLRSANSIRPSFEAAAARRPAPESLEPVPPSRAFPESLPARRGRAGR